MKRQAGVTLIELLVVVTIIGILSSIALPAYRDYVIRGKLTDSQASLGATRTRLEQYYQDNRSYPAECGGTAAGLPAFSIPTSQYFTYGCAAGATAGQTFVLTATGVSTAGTGGFTFSVNEQGDRNTTGVPSGEGWSTKSGCWITKKPNIC
jgi:type IV pilus assembly protein PilE